MLIKTARTDRLATILLTMMLASPFAWSGYNVPPLATPVKTQSCFLLFELGVGEIRRKPVEACTTRISPASTFKIPHALTALDAGVISNVDEMLAFDGTKDLPESWRRDHTLASAMRYSVVWYFQRIAERLGPVREREYLNRFSYGNMDSSSRLTTFWLGESLQITPLEQQTFLIDLYQGNLPIKKSAIEAVIAILVQPRGVVVNAAGEHPFDAPWPADAIVSAKTGSATDASGRSVRWLVGHVQRGERAFVFVSCVIGGSDIGANPAIDLAARALWEEKVL
jgi:beta-lactamase class D